MIKSISIYFFFFLAGILISNSKVEAQSRMDTVFTIKKLIQEHSTVSSPGVGLVSSPSKYWYAFAYLAYLSTDEELVEMTNDNNTAIRIYAYLGLTYNNYLNIKSIKKRILKDKASVNTFFGCISGKDMDVASCIKNYNKYCNDESSTKKIFSLLKNSEEYRNQLYDELIIDKKISRPVLID